MRYVALATDYDGTLAHDGKVDEETLAALERLSASGRKLLLVTGRHLPDLQQVFPRLDIFDRVVAENGALLFDPESRQTEPLCDAPSAAFLEELKRCGVPFEAGHCIVATWEPHQQAVLEAIKQLGLELQVIFNKGAVMVLPAGLNKGSGLHRALAEMGNRRITWWAWVMQKTITPSCESANAVWRWRMPCPPLRNRPTRRSQKRAARA